MNIITTAPGQKRRSIGAGPMTFQTFIPGFQHVLVLQVLNAFVMKLIHAIGAKGAILVAQLFYWSFQPGGEGTPGAPIPRAEACAHLGGALFEAGAD
jgi:hypothetical protein